MTKYTIISDIHGNYPALESIIDQSEPDNYLVTGDIIGLMGFPKETAQTVHDISSYAVKGNHDISVVEYNEGLVSNEQLSEFERTSVKSALTDDLEEWITSLDPYTEIHEESILMAHAVPDPDPAQASGLDSSGVLKRDYPTIGVQIDEAFNFVLLGHTHQQGTVDCRKFPDQDVIIANAGSAGQPLNGKARYVEIDTDELTADPYIAQYDEERVIDRLEDLDIPVKFWK